jgi:transcription termination/antitermination protein NusG
MTDEVETPSPESSAMAQSSNPDMRWYVVHAYSGMEKAVERNILERINRVGMQNKFGRILVPMEEVVEVKNGQKRTTERKFFPGYVLVEMIMDDDSWHLIKHTNKVTGFVGGAKNRPSPISQAEVEKIVNQMQEGTEKPRHKVEFEVGEYVASRKVRSPTSMVRSRTSTTTRARCAYRSRFSAVPHRLNWSSPRSKKPERMAPVWRLARGGHPDSGIRIFRLGAEVFQSHQPRGAGVRASYWSGPGVMTRKE